MTNFCCFTFQKFSAETSDRNVQKSDNDKTVNFLSGVNKNFKNAML